MREFAERCHVEEPHATHVQRLALRLFDALGERLGCAPEDRAALADAALLHDVGYHISYERHHKHSYHLILHADLLGIAPTDRSSSRTSRAITAASEPQQKHRNFGVLDKALRRRIRRLVGAPAHRRRLRPRPRRARWPDVKVRWTQRAIRITPVPAAAPRGAMRLEMWGAHRKSRLLAKLAGMPVEIVAPDGHVLSSDDVERRTSGIASRPAF